MSTGTDPAALGRLNDLEGRLRGPDLQEGSPGIEMAISIVLPGVPTFRRRPALGLLLAVVGVVVPVLGLLWAYANRSDLIGLALDQRFLRGVAIVGIAAVLVRLAAISEVAHAFRSNPGIGGRTAVATIAALALSVPVLWVSAQANSTSGAVGSVFSSSNEAPLFAATGGPDGDVTTDDDPVDPSSVTNILLLGGDAGPGRWGLRTDSMILVTIDDVSGRTSLTSIPRNLTRLQFPPGSPLAAEFPNGFDDLANAVFPYVSTRDDLMAAYSRDGLQPEAVALSEAIGYSLDVEIDDYALVNMQGFADVIDALGGVSIELDQQVPLPPSLPGERPLPDSVGPGVVDMDGAMAIAYARSRSADSDYQRMQRQRELLAALGSQVSVSDAIRGFGSLSGVLDDSMRTSLSPSEFTDLLDRLGNSSGIYESVGLTPPLINPGSPDYAQIRTIMDAVERAAMTGSPSGYAV